MVAVLRVSSPCDTAETERGGVFRRLQHDSMFDEDGCSTSLLATKEWLNKLSHTQALS